MSGPAGVRVAACAVALLACAHAAYLPESYTRASNVQHVPTLAWDRRQVTSQDGALHGSPGATVTPSGATGSAASPTSSSAPVDPSGGGSSIFSYPFVTLAVVAVGVFVLVVIAIAVRLSIWNRRSQSGQYAQGDGMYMPPNLFSSVPAVDPVQPPVLLEKTVAPHAFDATKPVTAQAPDWAAIQPVSVCFDRDSSNRIRTSLNAPQGANDPTSDEPLVGSAQVTCLVSLPTSRTVFPARLRKRSGKDQKWSSFNPLFQGPQTGYAGDLTGDLSRTGSLKRAPSIASRMSAKETSDARRDAYFQTMEREASEGGLAPPRPPLTRNDSHNSVGPTEHAPVDDDEHVGIFAFGSVILPIHKSRTTGFSEKNSSLTKADLLALMDQAHNVQGPVKPETVHTHT